VDSQQKGESGEKDVDACCPLPHPFRMICSMAEECSDADIRLPQALSLCVPVGGLIGLFFIIPICALLPPIGEIIENSGQFGQALPYIFTRIMGSPGGGLALSFLVLVITFVCSISITGELLFCLLPRLSSLSPISSLAFLAPQWLLVEQLGVSLEMKVFHSQAYSNK